MIQFLKKTWPYLLLGLAYFTLGEYLLYRLKENTSIKTASIIQNNSSRELYYGRQILGNALPLYKFTRLKMAKPTVLVLGQSVTLQFRDFLFEPFEKEFYNAGLLIRNISDLKYLAHLMEEGKIQKPVFMLLAIDPSFVLENATLDAHSLEFDTPEDRALSIKSHLKGMQKLILDAHLRKVPELNLGFGKAGMSGRGYRNDGSYRHRPEIERYLKDSSYYDENLTERLLTKQEPFIAPFRYDADKAIQFTQILYQFEKLGIELLLYVPPYSDDFFKMASKDSMFSTFWIEYIRFQDELKKEFPLIEFTTPSALGLDDRYMVDAEHPSEVLNGIQLKKHVLSHPNESSFLSQLTFKTFDSLMMNEHTLPISFLNDSVNLQYKLK